MATAGQWRSRCGPAIWSRITLVGVPNGNTCRGDGAAAAVRERHRHYIPIREIGAPNNLFNLVSNVKAGA
jgi:hypothetical protein